MTWHNWKGKYINVLQKVYCWKKALFKHDSNNIVFNADPDCQLMAMLEMKFIDLVRDTQKDRATNTLQPKEKK